MKRNAKTGWMNNIKHRVAIDGGEPKYSTALSKYLTGYHPGCRFVVSTAPQYRVDVCRTSFKLFKVEKFKTLCNNSTQ